MLPRGSSNTRDARGQSSNRSFRGRGPGSTSRGASSFSSKFQNQNQTPQPRLPPSGPRALQDSSNTFHRGRSSHRRNSKNKELRYNRTDTDTPPSGNSPFEQERLENAAKREQRGRHLATGNGRGPRGSSRGSKQVRFTEASSTEKMVNRAENAPVPATRNPFGTSAAEASPFGNGTAAAVNPFGTAPRPDPFKQSQAQNTSSSAPSSNPFGAPLQPTASNPFSTFSGNSTSHGAQQPPVNTFAKPSPGLFALPAGLSTPTSSGFSGSSSTTAFGAPSGSNVAANSIFSQTPFSTTFGAPSGSSPSTDSLFSQTKPSTSFGASSFGVPHSSGGSITSLFSQNKPATSFGTPSGLVASTNSLFPQNKQTTTFGAPSTPSAGLPTSPSGSKTSLFFQSKPTTQFGAPSGPSTSASSLFSQNKPMTTFGAPSAPSASSATPTGASSGPGTSTESDISQNKPLKTIGAPSAPSAFFKTNQPQKSTPRFGLFQPPSASPLSRPPLTNGTSPRSSSPPILSNEQENVFFNGGSTSERSSSSNAVQKMDQLLQKEGIKAPAWPPTLGDPKQKSLVEALWNTWKGYRNKVRTSLISGGLLDDPDKAKKLSDAIDFKGVCEEMCPDFEKLTRIMEHDVPFPEKDYAPDGKNLWPSPMKMIKALARSAAGQEAPLPMDVRSPACLRRTVDHLMHEVLGDAGDLPSLHGYLWNRTRAVRRDFVFQSSMSPTELLDQVDCLERISRFHVVSLHQMSRVDVVEESFVEQQELEQLGKALLSLIHTYDDCKLQGISCENEAEFRAYYVLFNAKDPGILETVQDWGWKFSGESEHVKIALSLVETLQNITDLQGPLKPYSATDIAPNSFSQFFSIVEDRQVSYTMACFAEIHFNAVRKSALNTILGAYRKQRDQAMDWTTEELNAYLRFDNENEIVEFAEAYGLRFEENDDEEYLVLEADNEMSDPFPALRQRHSYVLVECKRGDHSLPEVIETTVYEDLGSASGSEKDESVGDEGAEELEEAETAEEEKEDEESLFVKDNDNDQPPKPIESTDAVSENKEDEESNDLEPKAKSDKQEQPVPAADGALGGRSIFDQTMQPKTFGQGFFTSQGTNSSLDAKKEQPQTPSIFNKEPTKAQSETSSFFSKEATTLPPGTSSIFNKEPIKAQSGPSLSFAREPTAIQQEVPSIFSKVPLKDPPSIFASKPIEHAPSTNTTTPFPSFPSQPFPKSVEEPKAPAFLGTHTISKAPTENVQAPSVLGGFAVTQPPKSTQASPFGGLSSQPTSSFGPFKNGEQHTDPSSTHQPIPAPASFINTSSIFSSGPPLGVPNLNIQPQSRDNVTNLGGSSFGGVRVPPVDPTLVMDKLTDWVVNGKRGVVDHFAEYTLENLLRETALKFVEEEKVRKVMEEADEFRARSLSIKYFNRWRKAAHSIWVKRQGREARKARREMAESMRASKAAKSAKVVQDFKASVGESRRSSLGSSRNSLDSQLEATGVLNGVHNLDEELKSVVHGERTESPAKRQKRSRSTNTPTNFNKSQKPKRDNPLRRSLLSDPSYLTGGSRIHLLPNYKAEDENRRHVSGVQTDYFRLKARGITTLPNGTPLARSAAHDMLNRKRTIDGLSRSSSPTTTKHESVSKSAPAKTTARPELLHSTKESDGDVQALKKRARAIMSEDANARRKRSFDDSDEELFARAKRVREKMDEGSRWFREEIERETKSRSAS